MKLHTPKRGKLILICTSLLLVLGSSYGYFFYLKPLKTELKMKQQMLIAEQNALNQLGHERQAKKADSKSYTKEMQKKLPVKPLQDQFIMDLEKAETISGSQIKSMSFSNGSQSDGQTDQSSNPIENTLQQGNNLTPSEQKKNTHETSMPAGLSKLTVSLSVESANYEGFEKFIETLESLNRIVMVEAIDYSAEAEQTSLGQENKPFSYNLTVSAFYMSGLDDLLDQLPETETPAPANKQNPLSQFPDVNK